MKHDYAGSLLPVIGKDKVLEDLRTTKGELKEVALPAFNDALSFFRSYQFKDGDAKQKSQQFARIVKAASSSDGAVVSIAKLLPVIDSNLNLVEDLLDELFSEEIAAQGITYQQMSVLQFVEYAGFAVRYSVALLHYLEAKEAATYEGAIPFEDSFNEQETRWITENWEAFLSVMSSITMKTDNMREAIADIPEIQVTKQNLQTLAAGSNAAKIDPMSMRFIGVNLNPIYHFRMAIAAWQIERYKIAQETARVLEIRRLYLERLKNGKPDASLEKQIRIVEERISKAKYYIAMTEKGNG